MVEYRAILRADPCSYCGVVADVRGVDHIVPSCAGGLDGWENLTAACVSCNCTKAQHTLLGFLLGRGVGRDGYELRRRRDDRLWAERHAALGREAFLFPPLFSAAWRDQEVRVREWRARASIS